MSARRRLSWRKVMRIVCRSASLVLIASALLATAGSSATQTRATTADLSGLVLDASNAVVPGAVVTATNAATGVERSGTTERDGRYSIPALPPGTYTVKASLAGFQPQVAENIVLTLGGAAELNFALQGAAATSGLTFAGQRARSNNITVDGLDNNDATLGSVRATFSQEAVQEFQVLTNSYSAEFGKASGGVVNIVTKSGTNTTAGNAFFYGRDD